jgi:hypothetical protein
MFVKQYVLLIDYDFSGSSMSGRKLRYSFFSWYNGLSLETKKLTRIEYINFFEAEIPIGDVFACTSFNSQKMSKTLPSALCYIWPDKVGDFLKLS